MKSFIRFPNLILTVLLLLSLAGLAQAQPGPFDDLAVLDTIPVPAQTGSQNVALTPDG